MSTSLQDRWFPDLPCFGCGPANERGLRLRSYAGPDGTATATFTPWPEHDNGMGFLNGGIIATLLDCHSAAVVTQAAHDRGWPPLPGAALPYVTAGLEVAYLRPTPLHEPVGLTGELVEVSYDEAVALVRVVHPLTDGRPRAEARAVWRRWRPR